MLGANNNLTKSFQENPGMKCSKKALDNADTIYSTEPRTTWDYASTQGSVNAQEAPEKAINSQERLCQDY